MHVLQFFCISVFLWRTSWPKSAKQIKFGWSLEWKKTFVEGFLRGVWLHLLEMYLSENNSNAGRISSGPLILHLPIQPHISRQLLCSAAQHDLAKHFLLTSCDSHRVAGAAVAVRLGFGLHSQLSIQDLLHRHFLVETAGGFHFVLPPFLPTLPLFLNRCEQEPTRFRSKKKEKTAWQNYEVINELWM